MMMIGNVMDSDARLQQNLGEPQASLVSALNQSRAMADHAPGLARGFSSDGLHNKLKRPPYGKIGGNQQLGFVAGAEGNQGRVDWVSGCGRVSQKGVSASVKEMGSFSVGGSQELLGKPMEISGNIDGKRSCSEMHNAAAAKAIKCSLKIQVIDETALLETVSVPKGGRKEMGFAERERSRGKGKGARRPFDSNTRQKNLIQNGGRKHSRGKGKGVPKTKRVYSRKEMEALRFVQLLEQRKLWKAIYIGFGPSVAREYDDLANLRHQNFDPRLQRYGKNPSPGILGVATRGRGYHANIFVH